MIDLIIKKLVRDEKIKTRKSEKDFVNCNITYFGPVLHDDVIVGYEIYVIADKEKYVVYFDKYDFESFLNDIDYSVKINNDWK